MNATGSKVRKARVSKQEVQIFTQSQREILNEKPKPLNITLDNRSNRETTVRTVIQRKEKIEIKT